MSIACSFVWLVFYWGQREKESCIEWSLQGGLFCMFCMYCIFFWCFLWSFQELKELGKELDKLKKVSFFLVSMITKHNFYIGNCVLPGEGKPLCIECKIMSRCDLSCFLCEKKTHYFSCGCCNSRSLMVSRWWNLFLVYNHWTSCFTCNYINLLYIPRRRKHWKPNITTWPRTLYLHVFFKMHILNVSSGLWVGEEHQRRPH